jgi:sulfatase modifying factor 1
MKKMFYSLCPLLLACTLPSIAAPPTGILANQGKVKPVVTVANSYSEKVVRTFSGDADSGPIYEVQQSAEKVSAKVMALLGDFDFNGINSDMVVALSVGDFSFSATLGEAGTRKLEPTGNATFTLNLQVPQLDADGGAKLDAEGNEIFTAVRMGTLNWAWNASSKRVTATLVLVIPGGGLADTVGVGGIASERFAALREQIQTGGERRFGNQPVPVTLRFGEAQGSRDAFVGGVTRTRALKMPGAEAPYVTTSVVLAGGADTRGPQLSVRVPARVENAVAVFAGLADRPAPSGFSTPQMLGYTVPEVAVYVDQVPGEGVEPDFMLEYSDSRGNPLSEGALGLNPKGAGYLQGRRAGISSGAYVLRIVAIDSEGNMASLVKTVVSAGTGVLRGMVKIPAGIYQRGNVLGDSDITDAPVQSVMVSDFYIQENLVTKALWDEVRTWGLTNGYADLAPGAGKASNHPVQTVSWYDVVKWANAVSEYAGFTPCYTVGGVVYRIGSSDSVACDWNANGYRLPTEAEWEVAARGGLVGKRFPWGDTISHSQANYYSLSDYSYDVSPTRGFQPAYAVGGFPYTSPVGSFASNGYGLKDMAGNVFQWCWDWYETYVGGSDPRGPSGPSAGSNRVARGVGWDGFASNARCAQRYTFNPSGSGYTVGFRLARANP